MSLLIGLPESSGSRVRSYLVDISECFNEAVKYITKCDDINWLQFDGNVKSKIKLRVICNLLSEGRARYSQ
jgi:hypothetical protein